MALKSTSYHKTLKDGLMRKIPRNQKNEEVSLPVTALPPSLDEKMKLINPHVQESKDVKVREFVISGEKRVRAIVIFIEGLIEPQALNTDVLQPLMIGRREEEAHDVTLQYYMDRIEGTFITVGGIIRTKSFSELVNYIFDGLTVLLIDGFDEVLVIDIRGGMLRAIEEPPSERTTRGPRDGFIENLVANIALIRRRLRDPNLIVEKTIIGQRSRTDVAILYIKDVADPAIVKRIRDKLNAINIDGTVAASYIEQLIDDHPFSVFPTIKGTQRPDRVTAALLQGQVAICTDGTPHVLLLPALFVNSLQAIEDYIERPYVGSFNRLFRFAAFFIAVSLPSLYISLISFQPELLPYEMVLPVAQQRSEVAFPAVIEALIMEVVIQLVVEAGLRLPMPLGQTIGIVGAIILGQMAVQGHLASPAMVIVVAITAIGTFAIPDYSMSLSVRVLRLPLMLFSAVFGLFGFSLGWMLILTHMASLTSVGVPFMSPLMPTHYADLKDAFIRSFLTTMKKRPQSIPHQDEVRQRINQKPKGQ